MGDYYETFEPPYYPAPQAKGPAAHGDDDLAADLRARLAHLPLAEVAAVDVLVQDRVVTLKGSVRSKALSEYLCKVAANAPWVRGVRSELTVN